MADRPDALACVGDLLHKVTAPDLFQAAESRSGAGGLQLLHPSLPVLLQEAVVPKLVLQILQTLQVLAVQQLRAPWRLLFGRVGVGLPDGRLG